MKVYTVTEALQYLKQLYPDVSPRNEETIRRAIRNGDLKAERGYGRDGNRISESALLEFSQKYAKKMQTIKNTIHTPPQIETILTIPNVNNQYKLEELLKNSSSKDKTKTKILLLEAQRKWEEKRNVLLTNIQILENELRIVNKEITLLEKEMDFIEK